MDVKLIEADALRVGPNDVLIIRLKPSEDENANAFADALGQALVDIGLEGRSLVLRAELDMAVVEKEPE